MHKVRGEVYDRPLVRSKIKYFCYATYSLSKCKKKRERKILFGTSGSKIEATMSENFQ